MRDVIEVVLRVLCVDDNHDTADSQSIVLEIAGCDVRACYDGETALTTAELFLPEVCVLDLNMPGMAGDEVAIRVRAGVCGPGTIMIALTGLPEPEARRRTAAAAFDLYLTKPTDPERLANILIDLVILRASIIPHLPTIPPTAAA